MGQQKKVLILGCNFAGLGAAQKIREYAGYQVDITCVDQKSYLDFTPNIPSEALHGRDPAVTMHMPIVKTLKEEGIQFVQGEVKKIHVEDRRVAIQPSERPGSPQYDMTYDYLVVALGTRLAFDDIKGFAEYGHAVSDAFHTNRLMNYLSREYKGGPIAIGSARFQQGQKGKPDWLPTASAVCEGPAVEFSLSLAHWLEKNHKGGAQNITLFTPAKMIAEDAGEKVVTQLLKTVSSRGLRYKNNMEDIDFIDQDGIQFKNGEYIAAELKVVFPNWKPHIFMKGLPISDELGFVVTDLRMRNPDHPEVFACGDAAAITVPKLESIGHQECEVVGKQIAADIGVISIQEANKKWMPEVVYLGDMGDGKAFYIHSSSWFGGDKEIFKIGHLNHDFKWAYQKMFFQTGGKIPSWGYPTFQWMTEKAL